jgi:hypothetical protein
LKGWLHIGQALAVSPEASDVRLAGSIALFIQEATSYWNPQKGMQKNGMETQRPIPMASPQFRR